MRRTLGVLLALTLTAVPPVSAAQTLPPPPAPPPPSATATPSAVPLPSASPMATELPTPGSPVPLPTATPTPPPAGVVPAEVTLELAGTVSPAFVLERATTAIAARAQLRSGATVKLAPLTLQTLAPGSVAEAVAAVTIQGNGAWSDVNGATALHVHVASLPHLDPVVLFYSDDPERLGPLDDGVLFRARVDASRSARVYAYHVSDAGTRTLYLAFTPTTAASRVQVLGGEAGPSDAFSYVGHLSTVRYLQNRGAQQSLITPVAPGAPYLVQLGAGGILPGQLVAAIYDVRLLDGAPVDVAVIAASSGIDPLTLLGGSERPTDGHYRRGEFSLVNVPPLALTFAAGGPEPQPFTLGYRYDANGRAAFPNLRAADNAAGGQRAALSGDYGVVRNVALTLGNPTADPQRVYLYEQPGANGGVTTTFWFDGDPAPTEVLCVSDPSQRYLVRAFDLGPNTSRTITGVYMTDGTSFLPIAFGLTSTPPQAAPRNGCGGVH